jgi:superfamily II DNA or RNA helicase
MFVEKRPRVHKEIVITQYDISKYKKAYKDKRDENNKPFKNATAFCLYLRKICNEDESKIVKVRELLLKHNKVIIFYNYLYEKEILLKLLKTMRTFNVGEYNGQHHDDIPIGDRWAYLCQYTAASEGWNCLLCDTMIFFSMNYSYKAMEQAAGRINRVNTPYKDLYYYYLRTTSSIDLSINRALSTKKNFNESTFIGG